MGDIGAGIAIAVVAGIVVAVVSFILRRLGAGLDRWHATSSSRQAAELESDLARIADTRDFWLDLVALLQKAARNDWDAGARVLRDGLEAHRYPRAEPGLASDPDLIRAMTTTIPQVFERLGKVPRDLADELDLVSNVVRRAASRQEAHRRRTGHLLSRHQTQQAHGRVATVRTTPIRTGVVYPPTDS